MSAACSPCRASTARRSPPGPEDGSFDRFGTSVSAISDLNGDGVKDILVGAPGSTALGDPSGFVRVISGKTFGVLRTTYGMPFDTLGSSVAAIGDINGDGVADYVAGSPQDFHQAGVARLISGADGKIVHSFPRRRIAEHLVRDRRRRRRLQRRRDRRRGRG
jgi:hypothetical protein